MPPPTISLVHALGKIVQDFKFGRNLGAADDGEQRMLGRMEDTGYGFEFGGHEQAHAGDLGETDGPFGGSRARCAVANAS